MGEKSGASERASRLLFTVATGHSDCDGIFFFITQEQSGAILGSPDKDMPLRPAAMPFPLATDWRILFAFSLSSRYQVGPPATSEHPDALTSAPEDDLDFNDQTLLRNAQRLRVTVEFAEMEAALGAFDLGDERLRLLELCGDVALPQMLLLPKVGEIDSDGYVVLSVHAVKIRPWDMYPNMGF